MKTLLIKLQQLQDQKADLENKLDSMKNDPVQFFEGEIREQYHEMLEESYREAINQVPFLYGSVADLMEENDPTQYRCGFNDYADSFDVTDQDEYRDIESEIEDIESEIEDLEEEIEELENEKD